MSAHTLDCTAAEYHADPAPEPSLSSSIANVLLDQSPLHAWHRHPRLGGQSSPDTEATSRGTLLHTMVLDSGPTVVTVDANDWRTKAAREAKETAESVGHVAVLEHVFEAARLAANNIKANLRKKGANLTGQREQVILWQEDAGHGPIWCRAMLDHIDKGAMIVIEDLKTCRSAHPDQCLRSVVNYGYDVQAMAYTRAVEALYPEYAGRVMFRFLFAEYEPPYAVTVATLDALLKERGERRWCEAVQTWSRCLKEDNWPGYSSQPTTLWSPSWLLNRETEASALREGNHDEQ